MEMRKSVEIKDLFSCKTPYIKPLFEGVRYPWELLSSLRAYIEMLVARGIDGFTLLKEGVLVGEGVCGVFELLGNKDVGVFFLHSFGCS